MRKSAVDLRTNLTAVDVATIFARDNLEGDDLTRSRFVLRCIRNGKFELMKSLLSQGPGPSSGLERFYTWQQFSSLVKKVPFQGASSLRKERAILAFNRAEEACGRTNERFRHGLVHDGGLVSRVLFRARDWLQSVLGPEVTWADLQSVLTSSRPGSGIAIGTQNRYRVSLPFKLGSTDLAVTYEALPYARLLVEGTRWKEIWTSQGRPVKYEVAPSSRISFVPKDALTLRTIAIEPSLNVWLQLGVHAHFAEILRRLGNSITDQSRNGMLAREGSITPLDRSVATIDLSSASDTVSRGLVKALLPPEWFAFLDDLRCKTYTLDGETRSFAKFSSMGNGFTFALETLLFLALARACNHVTGGEISSCYGDDIIISSCSALLLTEVLEYCGFTVNTEKSYYHGPFRESCGYDWFAGLRVTPQKLKVERLQAPDVYNLHNRIDHCFRVGGLLQLLRGAVTDPLYGYPDDNTSGHFFAPARWLERQGFLRWKREWQTFRHKTLIWVPDADVPPMFHAYLAALLGSQGSRAPLRGLGYYQSRWTTQGRTPDLPRVNTV